MLMNVITQLILTEYLDKSNCKRYLSKQNKTIHTYQFSWSTTGVDRGTALQGYVSFEVHSGYRNHTS